MAQRVIKNNESLVPFFGDKLTFIRGLDPLGLQNTSDSTFSLLLPGLNNVTGRIRYYSFYCWLLDQYSIKVGSLDPEIQRTFIRKAEYVIALCSHYYAGESNSIPGSLFAGNQIFNNSKKTFSLAEGILNPEGGTSNTYWNFSWGAFGQYYLGSLKDIGLIVDRDFNSGVFARSNSIEGKLVSGEMLAHAFASNLPIKLSSLFLEIIENGFVDEVQIKILVEGFDLRHVPLNSSEQMLLVDLLIDVDKPSVVSEAPPNFRRTTLIHLLRYIHAGVEELSDRNYIYHIYNQRGKVGDNVDECLFGWYYYQFNEFWQYANTSILNGVLDHLEFNHGPNWVDLQKFIDEIVLETLDYLIARGHVAAHSDKLSSVIGCIESTEYDFFNETRKGKRVEKIGPAFMLIFSMYQIHYEELPALKHFGEHLGIARDGEASGYFLTQFKNHLEASIFEFLHQYILKQIIYRHQYVAFRKMGGGSLSTQKFILEEHHIRFLGNFDASYTGPRVGNLISFLKDLGVVSKDDKLTEFGLQLMN